MQVCLESDTELPEPVQATITSYQLADQEATNIYIGTGTVRMFLKE